MPCLFITQLFYLFHILNSYIRNQDGLSPREAHMVSSNVSSRSSLMSGLADHVEFWRRALDNLKAAGALTPALEKSVWLP